MGLFPHYVTIILRFFVVDSSSHMIKVLAMGFIMFGPYTRLRLSASHELFFG